MSRPDPIQYADRLYAAIRAANFSPISFLAFGNAVKEGVELRRMPRIAAEPFMRVVGEMLDLEEEAARAEIIDADVTAAPLPAPESSPPATAAPNGPAPAPDQTES
jgi:hypothetical protein